LTAPPNKNPELQFAGIIMIDASKNRDRDVIFHKSHDDVSAMFEAKTPEEWIEFRHFYSMIKLVFYACRLLYVVCIPRREDNGVAL
jgi:hypothetical protein